MVSQKCGSLSSLLEHPWAPEGSGLRHCLSQLKDFPQPRASLLPTGWEHSSSSAALEVLSLGAQLRRVQARNPRGFADPGPDPHELAVLAPTMNPSTPELFLFSAPELFLLSSFGTGKKKKKSSLLVEVFVPRAG